MIYQNNKDTTGVYFGIRKTYAKTITAVYNGTKMVWLAIASCFGGGQWYRDYTWRNDDTWKND